MVVDGGTVTDLYCSSPHAIECMPLLWDTEGSVKFHGSLELSGESSTSFCMTVTKQKLSEQNNHYTYTIEKGGFLETCGECSLLWIA